MVAGLAVALVLYNNLVNFLPQALHDQIYVPLNLTVGFLLLAWARSSGLSWQNLGLTRRSLRSGARWGLSLGIMLPSPLFLALVLPEPSRALLDDPRLADVTATGLIYLVLVRFPLGTALFAEVTFRGVLYGAWARSYGVRSAMFGSSVVFGLWHVIPTLELLQSSDHIAGPISLSVGVLGGVLATFLGGVFFGWLRWRTGGIYGPFLTHWLVNSLATLAGFLARGR